MGTTKSAGHTGRRLTSAAPTTTISDSNSQHNHQPPPVNRQGPMSSHPPEPSIPLEGGIQIRTEPNRPPPQPWLPTPPNIHVDVQRLPIRHQRSLPGCRTRHRAAVPSRSALAQRHCRPRRPPPNREERRARRCQSSFASQRGPARRGWSGWARPGGIRDIKAYG